ncbi:MAG: NDP-sugar synthase [Candidatus Methanomethylophilaceae archaeon]|nr:NDP-sugar synthase [Candidatus Methanomethylophilaceae archaeon]
MRVRQAVVMVGGQGTRLRPLTENRPKPVLPVAGKPCIWYLLRSMADAGIEEIFLACGYRPEMISEALGDGSDLGVRLVYSYEKSPMGTGGALKLLESRLDPVFLAANGDVFADIDITGQIARHFSSGADVTIALASVPNPWEFGVARVTGDGFVSEFREGMRPHEVFSDMINAGVYVVDRRVLSLIPEGSFYDFSKHLFPEIISRGGRLAGFPVQGIWMDVGRPSDYMRANMLFVEECSQVRGDVCGGTLSGVYIGDGAATFESDLESVVLMDGSTVRGCGIRRAVILESSTVEGAVIEDSIVGMGCKIMPGAVVRNSVLADGTVIGQGEVRDDGLRLRET